MIDDRKEIIYQDKKFSLSWDKKTKVVESVALGQMSSQEFRACLDRLLAGLREKRARKCLADLSNAGNIAPEDLMWSETDFWPRCLATGVATFAVVMPKSLAAHLALDKVFQAWVPEKKGGERRFFADAESARKWLTAG